MKEYTFVGFSSYDLVNLCIHKNEAQKIIYLVFLEPKVTSTILYQILSIIHTVKSAGTVVPAEFGSIDMRLWCFLLYIVQEDASHNYEKYKTIK